MEFQNLLIEQTPKTPKIDLNHLTGELILSGRSIPENAAKVYEPVLNWVREYILKARPITLLKLDLEYFNTTSSIWLVKILKVLGQIRDPQYKLVIHLYLPVEEFNGINEFEDIMHTFSPITDILKVSIPSVDLILYGKNDKGEIIKTVKGFI